MMDYTELHRTIVQMANAQGIDESYIERHETLYYDESGNDKLLHVQEGKLNAEYAQVFVLGGIQAESSVTLDELRAYMGKSPNVELKAKKDLKGSFSDMLRKDNLRLMLELLAERSWYIHFDAVQVLYYGFVDIIDSVDGFQFDPFECKSVLYEALKLNPDKTVDLFKKCKYPNIMDENIATFLDGIIDLIDVKIAEDAKLNKVNMLLCYMRSCFEKAKKQKHLTFIQQEETHVWVKNFVQFYRQEILTFPKKTLVFDEEKQVQRLLSGDDLSIEGKRMSNYSFIESNTNAMLQISDYVVSILRKYIMFLDRMESEVEADIKMFDSTQLGNYRMLNSILYESCRYNPMFVHFTANIHVIKKYHKYMNVFRK